MNTAIDIIDYRVVEISVKLNPDFNGDATSKSDFNISTDFYNNTGTEPLVRLVMSIKNKNKASLKYAYKIALIIEGLFSHRPNMEKKELDPFLRLNASSILYGLARSTVSQTTAIMTNGKVLLPTVNFYDARQEKAAKKKSK